MWTIYLVKLNLSMQVVFSYSGPGNPSVTPHPYVFLLFRQRFQNIILDENWILRITIPFELQMNLQEFMMAHDLEGIYFYYLTCVHKLSKISKTFIYNYVKRRTDLCSLNFGILDLQRWCNCTTRPQMKQRLHSNLGHHWWYYPIWKLLCGLFSSAGWLMIDWLRNLT